MTGRLRLLAAGAVTAAGVGGTALWSVPASSASTPSSLLVEGGSFAEPLANKVLLDDTSIGLNATFFEPNVDVARQDFASGTADALVSEFPLTAAEVDTAHQAGRSFAYVPFAASAVGIGAIVLCNINATTQAQAVCPGLQVSAAQLEGLFTNRIQQWSDSTDLPTISGGTGPVSPQIHNTVVPITQIDPSAANSALESYLDQDATAKPLWEAWVAHQLNTKPVSETWPTDGGISGGDMAVDNALIPVNPTTGLPNPSPSFWGITGNVAPVPADWLGAPWSIPTLAVQNASGAFVSPTATAESAALGEASIDPSTNLVTFPANGGSAAGAYPLMVTDYLVVPTTGLSTAKATALAQLIKFLLGSDGSKDITSLGAVPVSAPMAQAGLAVADQLAGGSTSSSSTTTTSPAAGSGGGQGSSGGGSGAALTSDSGSAPSLAFTGLRLAPLVASGCGLLAVGLVGRRWARRLPRRRPAGATGASR